MSHEDFSYKRSVYDASVQEEHITVSTSSFRSSFHWHDGMEPLNVKGTKHSPEECFNLKLRRFLVGAPWCCGYIVVLQSTS